MPVAPNWFVRKLREISPRLGVRWDPRSRGWEITERVPTLFKHGRYMGMELASVRYIPERVVAIPGIGSAILTWVKERDFNRFKNFHDFNRKMKVRPE